MTTNLPKGTKDFFGQEIKLWEKLENVIKKLCNDFGVGEIRTPTFEYTDLFIKSTGETSDIVQKEMYTFLDRGGKSLTLKPEGTPGTVRAYINHMQAELSPTKLFYITSLFRCERPQAGRMRQFHQFGVEYFGSYLPTVDAEVISMVNELFNRLNLKNIELHINSLGCKDCKLEYNNKLRIFLNQNFDNLCSLCKERSVKNPLRVLDCKNNTCQKIFINAPLMLDSLDNECELHFKWLQFILKELNINFVINPKIVRGLDYYSKTVFEFISTDIGAQSTICGGGRYDSLIENSGGHPTGAVGFGLGMERLIILMQKQHSNKNKIKDYRDIFIGHIGDEGMLKAMNIALKLRQQGVSAENDLLNRSVKAQLKYAGKIGAKYTVIIGDDEIKNNVVSVKNMDTGEKFDLQMDEIAKLFLHNDNLSKND